MKSPAFQFYPADYLADMRVRMLSWASRGLYIDLLCYCWREGWIPSDSSAIAQLCHCHDLAIVEPCLELFLPHESDPKKLIHGRLEREREKQIAFSNERKSAGIKGATKRWGKNSSAIQQPIAKNGSSSSSSSSSSDNIPPTPQGGIGENQSELFSEPKKEHVMPDNWKRLNEKDRKKTRVLCNSKAMNRIGGFFNRRPSTLWTVSEAASLMAINPTPEEVDLVERFYLAPIPKEEDFRHHDLDTLLNNWAKAIDRAENWRTKQK